MMIFKKINKYFFGEESLSLSDTVWFYGIYAVMLVVAIITVFTRVTL